MNKGRIKLNITSKSRPMSDEDYDGVDNLSFGTSGNGIEVIPKDESLPIPWDAGCWIEGSDFCMEGHAGPGGFGYASCKIPLGKVNDYVDLQIYAEGDAYEDLEAIFGKYGWL